MLVIAIYDVNEKRVAKMKKIFDQYMHWTQNSVFEGELTKVQLRELKQKIKQVMNNDEDSVIFYTVSNPKWIKKESYGIFKPEITNIL